MQNIIYFFRINYGGQNDLRRCLRNACVRFRKMLKGESVVVLKKNHIARGWLITCLFGVKVG